MHPETGRIHCSFDQTVAATGRLSSSQPEPAEHSDPHPLGQEIRAAFVPAEGRVLLSADYSQIELRILAHLCEDPELVKAFREGADIHVRTASQVFGTPEAEVTPEQRARTKAINFGIIYGQSGFGLSRVLGISQSDAREHIDAYFARYPGVRAFIDERDPERQADRLRAHPVRAAALPAGPAPRRTGRCARRPSAWPSTRSSRAPPRT